MAKMFRMARIKRVPVFILVILVILVILLHFGDILGRRCRHLHLSQVSL